MDGVAMKDIEVIIPFNNEALTISKVLSSIRSEMEMLKYYCVRISLVLIDDGSTDGSYEAVVRAMPDDINCRFLRNNNKSGKGFSVRRALCSSSADLVFVQDADLEYPFYNLRQFLDAMGDGEIQAVFGARFNDKGLRFSQFPFWFFANKVFTAFVNLLFNCGRADVTCGQVLIRRSEIMRLGLVSCGFEFETELAIKSRGVFKYVNIPIKYFRRAANDGKKLKLGHAVKIVLFACVMRIRLRSSNHQVCTRNSAGW